jgi:hypothetical protein
LYAGAGIPEAWVVDPDSAGLRALQYNFGYTAGMKTAVSIPDELFVSAERLARRLGMSRSELYARALRQYVREHRNEGITERLDAIYGTEPSELDPTIRRLQARSLPEDAWRDASR